MCNFALSSGDNQIRVEEADRLRPELGVVLACQPNALMLRLFSK